MKTLLAILAVVLIAAAVFVMDEGRFPWEESGNRPAMTTEDNGMVGRLAEFVIDLYWNPVVLAVSIVMLFLGTAGLVVYWKSIQD